MAALAPVTLIVASLVASAQSDPLLGERFEYVVYLGEEEVGREEVELSADGWSAEGRYDFMGVRKGKYLAALRHGEERRLEYDFTTDDGGKERSLRAVYAGENWTVTAVDSGKERSTGIGSQPVFAYDDLLWACMIGLGRLLVALEDANELPPGTKVTALSGAGGVGFPVEFVDSSRSPAIRGGVQRLRYASDPRRDSPVPPGTVAKVTIDCWATGLRLAKGERLLLKLSSWGWPGYGRNLNTLEPALTAKEAVVATNTIHHDARHPRHLLLPVVPRADAPGLAFEE